MSQGEVQAAHFSYEQVTLFTSCAWTQKETQLFSIVSDHVSHEKYSAITFIRTILDFLIGKSNGLREFHIFFGWLCLSVQKQICLVKFNYASGDLQCLNYLVFFCHITRQECCGWNRCNRKKMCLDRNKITSNNN